MFSIKIYFTKSLYNIIYKIAYNIKIYLSQKYEDVLK